MSALVPLKFVKMNGAVTAAGFARTRDEIGEFAPVHQGGEVAQPRIEIGEALDRAIHDPARIAERPRRRFGQEHAFVPLREFGRAEPARGPARDLVRHRHDVRDDRVAIAFDRRAIVVDAAHARVAELRVPREAERSRHPVAQVHEPVVERVQRFRAFADRGPPPRGGLVAPVGSR
jgi:hypothetical protein